MTPRLPRSVVVRHRWVGALVALLVLLGSPLGVAVVGAHADLVAATPAHGERVGTAPDTVVLRFSEGVQVADVTVSGSTGERVDRGVVRLDGTDPKVVRVPLSSVPNGTYTLSWEVLSVDGHTTRGSYYFVVGDALPDREQLLAALAADAGGGVNPLEPVARGLLFVAALLAVGVPLALLIVVDPVVPASAARAERTARLLAGVAALLVVAVGLLAAVRTTSAAPALTPEQVSAFLATRLGRLSAVQVAVALGTLAVAVLPLTGRVDGSDRRWLAALVAVALAVSLTVSLGSHSAATVDGPLGVLVDFAHTLGAAVWVGGLAALAVLASPFVDRTRETTLAARLACRFSVVATAGLGLAVATGLLLASWHVPTAAALLSTPYGQLLAVKVALVLAAAVLGAVNRFVVRPLLSDDGRPAVAAVPGALLASRPAGHVIVGWFHRLVRVELGLLLVVLALTGVMTALPTAGNVHAVHEDGPETVTLVGAAGDVDVRLDVLPLRVGPSVLDVSLSDGDGPLVADESVEVLLRHPERDVTLPQVTLVPTDGRYSAVTSFPAAGEWEVRVSAWADGRFVAERFTVTVPPAGDGMAHDAEDGSDLPDTLRTAALGVGGLTLLAVAGDLLALRRSRR